MLLSNLTLIRKQKKISQKKICKALNVSQTSYSSLETGRSKMDMEMFFKIIDILQVHPFELLPPQFAMYFELEGNGRKNKLAYKLFDLNNEFENLYEHELNALEELLKRLKKDRGIVQNKINLRDQNDDNKNTIVTINSR